MRLQKEQTPGRYCLISEVDGVEYTKYLEDRITSNPCIFWRYIIDRNSSKIPTTISYNNTNLDGRSDIFNVFADFYSQFYGLQPPVYSSSTNLTLINILMLEVLYLRLRCSAQLRKFKPILLQAQMEFHFYFCPTVLIRWLIQERGSRASG